MVFPVVMYGCESWTIKKAKHQRIDAFELKGLMLKLQHFGHLVRRVNPLEKTPMLGKIVGKKRSE